MLDIARGSTVYLWFETTTTAQVPITLAGSPVVKAFVGSGTSGVTTGVTLTVDAGSITGSHLITIVTTNLSVYIPGSPVTLKITTGTVDSVSVIAAVVGEFGIEYANDGRKFQGTAAGVSTGGITLDGTDTSTAVGDTVLIFTADTNALQRRIATDITLGVATFDRAILLPTGVVTYRTYPSSLGLTAAEIFTGVKTGAIADPIEGNVKEINGAAVAGIGTSGDKWRAA